MNTDFQMMVEAQVGDKTVTVYCETHAEAWAAENAIRNMARQFGLQVGTVTITVNDTPRWRVDTIWLNPPYSVVQDQ